ncbi:MgtC/SapB family protein [Komagataeibacter sp. FNDCR2]|uniref:MgtC/SapB family protein n=1 Tax=Komagataeibacter sp. FNDCR2 TaxID=2878682 RepID=UPI001E54C207|nr:MgtC/SapB family protein [Komagataeibacter sp. FNDCR2]MCE2574326.1 MgtC/SapB family protein [Komagataeibacter sp. FNDCR2]
MIAGTWHQLADLLAAFVLSAMIGLEREFRQKSAGMRTHALVGLAAALIMLVSKYGFGDVLVAGKVILDPSRIAAQVVSGIGFIGGGVIFMRRDAVRGLTTAASVWLTAAVGMACGAGLIELALAATAAHFIIMFVFPCFTRLLPQERPLQTRLDVSYTDGMGILRHILVACTRLRFAVDQVHIAQGGDSHAPIVTLTMQVKGKRPVSHLIAALTTIEGVQSVGTTGDEGLD